MILATVAHTDHPGIRCGRDRIVQQRCRGNAMRVSRRISCWYDQCEARLQSSRNLVIVDLRRAGTPDSALPTFVERWRELLETTCRGKPVTPLTTT